MERIQFVAEILLRDNMHPKWHGLLRKFPVTASLVFISNIIFILIFHQDVAKEVDTENAMDVGTENATDVDVSCDSDDAPRLREKLATATKSLRGYRAILKKKNQIIEVFKLIYS